MIGGVGVLHNVSQILAISNFFKQKNYWKKTLSARKNIIGNITLSTISRLNLDKFGIGNYIPDCRSAPFVLTIGLSLCVIYIGKCTQLKLIIDCRLERFQAWRDVGV